MTNATTRQGSNGFEAIFSVNSASKIAEMRQHYGDFVLSIYKKSDFQNCKAP